MLAGRRRERQEVGDARRDDAGLAGAGAGEDEQRALGGRDRVALGGVERREEGAVGPGARRRAAEEECMGRDKGRSYTTARPRARRFGLPLRCRRPHALRQHVPRRPHRAGRVPPARRQRRVGRGAGTPAPASSRYRSPAALPRSPRGAPPSTRWRDSASRGRSTRATSRRSRGPTRSGARRCRPRWRASAIPRSSALLTGRGYRLQGFENVLGRSLPVEPPRADRRASRSRRARSMSSPRGSTWW